MLPDAEALADVVVETVDVALGPVLERLAVAETRLATLGDLRDRVITMETRATIPVVVSDPALAERITAVDARLTPVIERLAQAESGLAALATVPEVDDVAPEELAASFTGLLRKELGDVQIARLQRRVIRDSHGKVDRVVEEPAA